MAITPSAVLDKVRDILKGEPARAIGYGGAAVIYLVAKAAGQIPDVSPEEALVQATAAIAVVASFVETIRRFVYSPNTVEAIVAEAVETGNVEIPAPPADQLPTPAEGVDEPGNG